MKHNNNFDFLRFLFSFLVVVGHTILLSKQPEFQNEFLASMPNYSVFSFFVISGFLVYSSFQNQPDLKKYFQKRAKRILPAYFLVVLFFAVTLFFISTNKENYFSSGLLKYLGANLIFLNFLQPCIPYVFIENCECAVNGSLWTIKVELMFYCLVPVLFLLLHKKSKFIQTVILILIYITSVLYAYFAGKHWDFVWAKQLPGCMMYFSSGMLIWVHLDFFKKYMLYFVIPAVMLLLAEIFLLNVRMMFAFSLAVLILAFAFSKIPLQNFGKYGDFSYGLYLVHFPVIQIFVHFGLYEKYSFFAFGATLVLTVFLAFLIWKFIEEPFLRKKIILKPL